MPREGTESFHLLLCSQNLHIFGNKMPREGTETETKMSDRKAQAEDSEIRCPERGRKPSSFVKSSGVLNFNDSEIRCPERGTEIQSYHIRSRFWSFIWK